MARADRQTVDLDGFPDLLVIYLGMWAKSPRGVRTMLGLGREIRRAVEERPDGLLLHETLIFSLLPPHLGMRQYWRDFDSMERWARELPHQQWWRRYLGDTGGTGFWHETYLLRGGMEAVYVDMSAPVGLARVAPTRPARGPMFSARSRAGLPGSATVEVPVAEEELQPRV